MNPDFLEKYEKRKRTTGRSFGVYTVENEQGGWEVSPEEFLNNEFDRLNYSDRVAVADLINQLDDSIFEIKRVEKLLKERELKIYDLESKIRKLEEDKVDLLEDLEKTQEELNNFNKTHNVKKLSTNIINKRLNEMPCVQIGEKDRILFVDFDEILKTEKEKDNFSRDLKDLLEKVESPSISLVFTNKKVNLCKLNSEQLVGFGLKKVQAVRKVFIQ